MKTRENALQRDEERKGEDALKTQRKREREIETVNARKAAKERKRERNGEGERIEGKTGIEEGKDGLKK